MASVNLESKISHLYEVRENLKSTIPNLEKVIKEQNSLINIISDAENKYDLSDEMVDSLIEDKQKLEAHLVDIAESLACVDTLIATYEKEAKENYKHSSMTTEAIFTLTCNALGLFKETHKESEVEATVEEPEEKEVN